MLGNIKVNLQKIDNVGQIYQFYHKKVITMSVFGIFKIPMKEF